MKQVVEHPVAQEIPVRRDRGRTGLQILFLTSAHNSMSHRAYVELTRLGHEVSVALATGESAMFEAVERHSPELIVAPMLRRAIPEEIWRDNVCIIVHPGPKDDRGPSSLDWAILEGRETWGVTLLQANAEMDAGDIWASHTFPMPEGASKSSLYREEVIEAAMRCLKEVVERFEGGTFTPESSHYGRPDVVGRLRPAAQYRDEELMRMRENFYGSDPFYHEARRRFVHKLVDPISPPPQRARGLASGARLPRELRAS